jgi:molybdate transport system substrate-binding protein
MMIRKRLVSRFLTFAILASIAAQAWQAETHQIKVMISGGFSAAYRVLSPRFEVASHRHLDTVVGPSMGVAPTAIPVRLSRGEESDVVIMVRAALDDLVKKGQVVEGSQVDLGRSRIGIAVKAGTRVPDIRSLRAFRRTLLRATSVAYSDSASGVYVSTELFKKLGIEKQMASKSRQIQAEPVGQVVARGEVEIGFQQISELKPIGGIVVVGAIPEQVQQITLFSAGLVQRSTRKEEGRALIDFLSSGEACSAIEESALEPIACSNVHVRKARAAKHQ